MKNKFYAALISLGMAIYSTTSFAGGTKGGGNPIEGQFELARSFLLQILGNYNSQTAMKLSETNRRILDLHGSLLLADISSVTFRFDHLSTEPFKHKDGSDSGIQTTLNMPLSPIEVRSKVLAPGNTISLPAAISWLGHEVGHHLQPIDGMSEEQKAWTVSGALVQLFNSQVQFPQLLNIGGDYVALGPKSCRNLAHIEADPFTGLVSIATDSTDSSQCTRGDLNWRSSGTVLVKVTSKGSKIISGHDGDELTFFPLSDGGVQIHFRLWANYPHGDWYRTFDLKFVKE
jgi:hypothetical protein